MKIVFCMSTVPRVSSVDVSDIGGNSHEQILMKLRTGYPYYTRCFERLSTIKM